MSTRGLLIISAMLLASSLLSEAQDKGKCGPNLSYKIEQKKNHAKATSVVGGGQWRYELHISGRGEMTETPWRNDERAIMSVILPDGLTSIADHAFEEFFFDTPTRIGLSRGQLTDKAIHEALEIPGTVTRIGDYAFKKSSFDYAPFIPDDVRFIGKESFAGMKIYWLDADDWSHPGDVIGGIGLEDIGDKAFYESNLPSFCICEDVRRLGDYVFAKNTELSGFRINNGLEILSEGTFFGCSNLKNIKFVNSSIKSIETKAFEGCSSLSGIELPTSLQTIGDRAFLGCSSLHTISIPEAVTSIGSYAFWNCSNLTEIYIPDSASSIGQGVLSYCSSLSSIHSKWSSKDERCLVIDDVLVAFAQDGLSNYAIPNGVKALGTYSFAGCNWLSSVILPEGLVEIGRYAFNGCSNLTSVTIPNGVTSIKKNAFEGCEALEMIIIPSSVSSIEENAFKNCNHLQYVCLMNRSADIADNAFPSNTKIFNYDPKNAPAIITVESLVLSDPYRTNVINGGTNNYVELSLKNEGTGHGKGTARLLMSGNTTGLSSSSVPFSIYSKGSAEIRIPIKADYSVATGYVNIKVQLTIDNGFSHGYDELTVQTQAHGVSADRLSDDGRRYKRAAEELLNKAKNADELLLVIREYEKLTQSDPYYADAFFNLGKLYTSLAKMKGNPYFDKAIENFRVFEKLLPEEKKLATDEIYAVQTLKKNYKPY